MSDGLAYRHVATPCVAHHHRRWHFRRGQRNRADTAAVDRNTEFRGVVPADSGHPADELRDPHTARLHPPSTIRRHHRQAARTLV